MRGGERVPLPAPRRRRASPARRRGTRRGRTCRPARSRPRSGRSSGCARGPAPRRPSGRTASRSPRCGMFPYGAWPSRIRSAPTTPASPTSITPRGVSTFSPIRNPRRNTAAAASTQVGQTELSKPAAPPETRPTARGRAGTRARDRRAGRCGRSPRDRRRRSETVKPSSTSRSRFRMDSGRRRSASPRRNTRQNASQTYGFRSVFPPNAPSSPARHLPCDLRPRPRLGDPTGRVLDDGLRDLTCLARPDLHEPRACVLVESRRLSSDRADSGRASRRSSGSRARPRRPRPRVRRARSAGFDCAAPTEGESENRGRERRPQQAKISVEVRTTRAYCRRSSPA